MIKAMLNVSSVNAYVDLHKKLKLPFKMIISNYTTRITSNAFDIHFMKNVQSNRVFAAYNKVKTDCLKKKMPIVNISKLQYYNTAFMENDFYSDVIYNIDLKSAYATVLFNDGFISKETFKYLRSLKKMERLAAVGMLAGKKNVYQIDESGEIQGEPEQIISPTAPYFFYCVRKTAEVMNEAAKYLGDAFLFTWVDGIYFLQEKQAAFSYYQIMKENFFDKKRFLISFEELQNFHVQVKKDFFICTFIKEGKNKIMKIPRPDNIIIKKITEHLINKDYNN